jgi:WD40 repeat protein
MSFPAAGTQEAQTREPQQKFKGHTDIVWGAIHLPGGQRIITCSFDGSLRLWNLENGLQIRKGWQDGNSPVWTIALSPDGKTVASGSGDGAVRLWNIETGKVIAKWTGHSDIVWSVCWSRDGQRVVSASFDGTARVWDVESGKTILGPINTGHQYVYAAVYSPDETMIATGGLQFGEKSIKIWDGKTFGLVTTLKGDASALCMAWTADGKRLISGSTNGSIVTWNTSTWKQLAVFTAHMGAIFAISISPNERILASASWDKTARLWNIENGQPIGSPLHHPNIDMPLEVFCISFSADGKLLATGCNEHTYTWDVSAIVKEGGGFDDLLSDSDVSERIFPSSPSR